ncbi:orotidine-5'-phosphate decarboxylase [Candidatus Peregrinibacteria bacterium HGW-Peregrinibacteria-1]|jgi:orotidine-5'-phosphate decarboxylase|nr:MAG: orotidine-5'-phosphate decarboxylase [Candidatus Peregrinibacteria bacterium HGW-Peregrinibacteria-1]
MKNNFADKLIEAVGLKGNAVCVGLDPRLDKIPEFLKDRCWSSEKNPLEVAGEMLLEFNKGIIDAVADLVPAVKLQAAFYEIYGSFGMKAYAESIQYAKSRGLLTIADVKRGDIGSTAEAYADAYLGEAVMFEGDEEEFVVPGFDADAITINPYMGWDSVKPFVEKAGLHGKGVFILVKTSNATSGDIQDLKMDDGRTVAEIVAGYVDSWGADMVGESGYSSVGAVVGATYPDEAAALRKLMPEAVFLVPGYGAQGATAQDVKSSFNADGLGAIVNNSRGIIHAYERYEDLGAKLYDEAARRAVEEMIKDLK